MGTHRRAPNPALLLLLATVPSVGAAEIENLTLSGTISARGNDIGFPENVRPWDETIDVVLTPDGSRVVYVADDDYDGVQELYSAPVDGSEPPCRIHYDLAPPACTVADIVSFAPTADSSYVVYLLGEEGASDGELWVAPVIRSPFSKDPVPLLSPEQFPDPTVAKFLLGPADESGSQQLVLNARPAYGERYRLYSFPFEVGVATGPALELGNGPVTSDASAFPPVARWQISPDGRWVVYAAVPRNGDGTPRMGIYSAEIGIPHSEVWLNEAATFAGTSSGEIDLEITADSTRVVYLGREENPAGKDEVLSVPIDGTSTILTRLSPQADPVSLNTAATTLRVSRSGDQVAFRWEEDDTLRTAKADGTQAGSVCAAGAFAASDSFGFVGDSRQLLFTTESNTSLRLCTPGAGVSTLFNAPAGRKILSFRAHPLEPWVTFLADLDTANVMELYSMPLDVHTDPVKIHGDRADEDFDYRIDSEGTAEFTLTPDGGSVVMHGEDPATGSTQLYMAPARPQAPGGTEILLSDPMDDFVVGGDVSIGRSHTLIASGSSRVIFAADRRIDGVLELFSASLTGTPELQRLNRGYAPIGGVEQQWASPDSEWIVYRADQDFERRLDLYAAPSDASTAAVRINDIESRLSTKGTGEEIQFSSDGRHVYFLGHAKNSGFHKLYAYQFETGTRILLSPEQDSVANSSLVSAFRHHPAGNFLVYLADHREFRVHELYRASLARPPSPIGDPLPSFADIRGDFRITPDGAAVVVSGDLETSSHEELFLLDLETGARTNLSDMSITGGDVPEHAFRFAAQGRSIVFLAPRLVASKDELFHVPLANPAGIARISGMMMPGEVEDDFQVSPNGDRAVFRAEGSLNSVVELFSVELERPGFPRIKLHEDLSLSSDILPQFVISPSDGNSVAFRRSTNGDEELLLGSIDGESTTRVVSPAPSHNDPEIGEDVAFSPTGNWLVFRSDARIDGTFDLYKVAMTGGGPELVAPGVDGLEGVISFAISPDGYRISYRLSQRSDDLGDPLRDKHPVECYSTTLDRDGPHTRLNRDQGMFTDVGADLVYLPDNSQLLFTDDRRRDETQELRSAFGRLQVSGIVNQSVPVNGSLALIRSCDFETPPEAIGVTMTSTDPTLFPPESLTLGIDGLDRTVSLSPASGHAGGFVTLTLTFTTANETRSEELVVFVGASEYRLWLQQWMTPAELDNPLLEDSLWGFQADSDDDGISNLAEWGKGLVPVMPDAESDEVDLRLEGSSLILRYRRSTPEPLTLGTSFQLTTDLPRGPWMEIQPSGPTTIISSFGDSEIVESSFDLPSPLPASLHLRIRYATSS